MLGPGLLAEVVRGHRSACSPRETSLEHACLALQTPIPSVAFLFVALGIGVSGGTSTPLPPTPTILSHLRPRSSSLPGLTRKLLCVPPGSGYGCKGDVVMLQDEHVTSGAQRRLSSCWGYMLDPVHTL